MKRIALIVVLILMVTSTYSQTTKGFNYQAVVRTGSGNVVISQPVTFHITLTNGNGSVTHYSETQVSTTSPFGVINLVVGSGTVETGTYDAVPWSSTDVVMKVEVKLQGEASFSDMGSVILRPVPFAMYALNGQPGPQGIQGEVGPQGPIGLQGSEGKEGPQGPQGPQGLQGAAGTGLTNKGTWITGSSYIGGDYVFSLASSGTNNSMWVCQSAASFVSSVLPKNDPSNWAEFQAPEGPQGPQGIQGIQGPKGDTGPIGLTGSQGLIGITGNGISQTINNGDGTFTFKYTDGTQFTTSNLTGPQGPKGDH